MQDQSELIAYVMKQAENWGLEHEVEQYAQRYLSQGLETDPVEAYYRALSEWLR